MSFEMARSSLATRDAAQNDLYSHLLVVIVIVKDIVD